MVSLLFLALELAEKANIQDTQIADILILGADKLYANKSRDNDPLCFIMGKQCIYFVQTCKQFFVIVWNCKEPLKLSTNAL